MATLSGTRLKDTYTGLLKTNDSGNFTSSLKVIQDGSGNDSALSLSSTTVKAAALQVNSITGGSSSTKALVWNDSSKAIEHRTFPSNSTVTTTVGATNNNPTITIEAADASSTVITFVGGDGIDVSRSSNTITVQQSSSTINIVSAALVLTGASSDSGSSYFVNAASGTFDITLPSAGAGLRYKFYIQANTSAGFRIVTKASSDHVFGRATVMSTTSNNSDVQVSEKTEDKNNLTFIPDSTQKGGNAGDTIECIAIDDTDWLVVANLTTSGSTVTGVNVFGGGT